MNSIAKQAKKQFQTTYPGKSFLLASDIDGTRVGDPEGKQLIKALVESLNEAICFAVITGRSLNSIVALVEEGRLPQPDFLVGAVGTIMIDSADPPRI